jgi:hypothetical protein
MIAASGVSCCFDAARARVEGATADNAASAARRSAMRRAILAEVGNGGLGGELDMWTRQPYSLDNDRCDLGRLHGTPNAGKEFETERLIDKESRQRAESFPIADAVAIDGWALLSRYMSAAAGIADYGIVAPKGRSCIQ